MPEWARLIAVAVAPTCAVDFIRTGVRLNCVNISHHIHRLADGTQIQAVNC
jgi:hypothetical protein